MNTGSNLVRISNNVHFGSASGTVLEVTRAAVEPDSIKNAAVNSKKWALWGSENDLPQLIVDLNKQDPTSSNAIEFKIKAHYSLGLMPHRKIFEKGKRIIEPIDISLFPEIEDFLYNSDINYYLQGVVTDFEWFNNCYTELIFTNKGDKVYQIDRKMALNIRAEKISSKTGEIENFYYSGGWPDPDEKDVKKIPAFNRYEPNKHKVCIYQHLQPSADKIYYNSPSWYSNAKPLLVSSEIFTWILSNLKNSVNVKYHIKIPQEYFLNLFPKEAYKNDSEWISAMQVEELNLKRQMDLMLAGATNASKTFYSKFAVDEQGQILPGWEIVPIQNTTNHEAFLPAYNTVAMSISTAHNVDPTLTGIQLSTGVGAGSGSDVREKFNAYVQLHTVIPRHTSLECLHLVKRLNKWPKDIFFDYENVVLQTLDQNKSGFAKEVEATPTTDKKIS